MYKRVYICRVNKLNDMKEKRVNVRMPIDTNMEVLRKNLKTVKKKTGKTANAKIAAYILKLAK